MLQQIESPQPALVERLALFLDIDGILHSTAASSALDGAPPRLARERRIGLVRGATPPGAYGLLVPTKQDLLADILLRNSHVVLVISSAWRNWIGYDDTKGGPADPSWERTNVTSLMWLKKLLHPVLASRMIGKTPVIGNLIDESSARATRLDEIRYFMQTDARRLGLSRNWVALDDQAQHFPKEALASSQDADELVVLVDGERGLEPQSSAELVAAINKASCTVQKALLFQC